VSLDELRADLKRNVTEASSLTSVDQIRDHLVNTLWPWLEAKLDVTEEIDDAVAELVDQQEDYLQPETGAMLAAVVASSQQISAELKKRAGGDATILRLVANHEKMCEQANAVLSAITMLPPDDGDGEETKEAAGAPAGEA
jgi:hypothetical protein